MANQPPFAVLANAVPLPPIKSTTKASTLNFFGFLDGSTPPEASQFLAKYSDGSAKDIHPAIATFLRITQDHCVGNAKEKEACWFTIRVTKPNDEFKVTRWHQDGPMYRYDKGREDVVRSKYAITLLGPSTLMLVPSEHTFATESESRELFRCWSRLDLPPPPYDNAEEADADLRNWLENKFENEPRVEARHDQVIRFSWGRGDSPIHSEPDLVCDRVFMSVLFGSEAEILTMCEIRKATFGVYEVEEED
ncbi:hypothetical protein NW752_008361 [Fusarium irregulare]|uniref:Uncharacterized protein n=1 Tax=Fusarium irregulare TaxID=2494466 RepID=A0A9W8PVP0_9HYPO|nr:hypothetical protein NW752_008361 [Fusarium irregulare]KAJ4019401.1 hypothetical protein NW766_003120 [Fusarium irregulare]